MVSRWRYKEDLHRVSSELVISAAAGFTRSTLATNQMCRMINL